MWKTMLHIIIKRNLYKRDSWFYLPTQFGVIELQSSLASQVLVLVPLIRNPWLQL